MIKINLLPQEMAGGRGGPAAGGSAGSGGAMVALVLILIFGVNIAIAAVLLTKTQAAKAALQSAQAEETAAKDELGKTEVAYSERKLDLERMEKLIEVANKLDPPERLLWSRKLNALPIEVPEGVYLTAIQVTQDVKEEETAESISRRNEYEKTKKGTPPVIEKVPNITQTLTMDGISYIDQGSENQRLAQVNQFYRNLLTKKVKLPYDKEPSSFMDGFVDLIEPSPFSTSQLEKRDVLNFKFTLNTRKVTID
ncbi:hypothetical protein BH09SUM1_BH09SUM1_11660 [soil metagenome]